MIQGKELGSEIMKETIQRQDLLWDQRHTFHFILQQTALYTKPANYAVQLAQLDRLERLTDVPNIKIGVVPLEAGLPVTENATFALYDNERLMKTVANGDIRSSDPQDIALHARIFADLDRRALYYDEAKKYIRQAISYFS